MRDIHQIIHRSNRFWHAMYYDALLEDAHYQLSYLKNSNRAYYNAAHALVASDVLPEIEAKFARHGIIPGIYWDEQAPADLKARLLDHDYYHVPEETENWYSYDLSERAYAPALNQVFNIKSFKPEPGQALDDFVAVNAAVNDVPPALAKRLKDGFLLKNTGVDIHLFTVYAKGAPVATTALGIVDGFGYTAEAATAPEFRRNGLFLALAHAAVEKARAEGCTEMHVNCDNEAFSNQGYMRYGYKPSFVRHYYQKKMA